MLSKTSAFRSAAHSLGYVPEIPKQIRFSMEPGELRGLYPPKHYAKAECSVPQTWAPATSTTHDDLQSNIESIELRHQADNIIYTDGSRKEVNDLGLVTSSGIYRRSSTAPLQLRVKPYGTGMLNTINRAELVAILVALRTCRPEQEECIATDSSCSMQKIARHLREPASTVNDCHRQLVHEICKLLLQRARARIRTDFVNFGRSNHISAYTGTRWPISSLTKQQRHATCTGTLTYHMTSLSPSGTNSGQSKPRIYTQQPRPFCKRHMSET